MKTRGLIGIALSLVAALFSTSVLAQEAPDPITMLLTAGESIPGLWNLVQAICYILGIGMVGVGIFKLKELGVHGRQSGVTPKTPILFLGAGAALVYLASAVDTMMVSMFGHTNIMAYTGPGFLTEEARKASRVVVGFINLVGLIAVGRSLYMVREIGEGRSNTTIGRVVTILIGGILCMNIVELGHVLAKTLGLSVFLNLT